MPGPRSDFLCLSKKCKTPEGAPVFELPVEAKRCPVCGSKRLQRIYAANISTGILQRKDPALEAAYEGSQRAKAATGDAISHKRIAPSLAVPISQLGPKLASYGVGALPVRPGKSSYRDGQISAPPRESVVSKVQRLPPRVAAGSPVDKGAAASIAKALAK